MPRISSTTKTTCRCTMHVTTDGHSADALQKHILRRQSLSRRHDNRRHAKRQRKLLNS